MEKSLSIKNEAYNRFLRDKQVIDTPTGLTDVPMLSPMLYPFQRDIASWALRRGRAAIWADCGLGKTPMQLEWANHVPGDTLILAPLAVSAQTVREGEKFGIPVHYCRSQDMAKPGINITNYEMLEHFDPGRWTGVVLDESSILKAYDGKTRTAIIQSFRDTSFKLACTATPAPNDYMELGNHAEFLGVMSRVEMLSMFFVHDGGETQKWRLKGHAEGDFWEWMASWAVMLRKPSDLGYSDEGFILPPIHYRQIEVDVERAPEGMLFALEAVTLQERIAARRDSVEERAAACAEIVNTSDESWILWCNLNSEADAIRRVIPEAVEVRGSDEPETKELRLREFGEGKIRVLLTKPSIAGWGLNWQHCHHMAFIGLSDSWEQYYQAVRRCWRFGQKNEVLVSVITAQTEGAVVSNIKRKEQDASRMAGNMVEHMHKINEENISMTKSEKAEHKTDSVTGEGWELYLGDCVDVAGQQPNDSVDYSVFSPPFASLYTYSNSDRDMGNCKNYDEFMEHFRFLVTELYRITKPGRLVSFHCMNLPTSKSHHGYIGLRDFRGELIRMFESEEWIYHSEVCIWKDPVTAMQRTKALGLLHKQLKKDSAMSRQGVPDYLVTMRKPGENADRISHTNETFPVSQWQHIASPIWMDINPNDTLQYRSAREQKDERHICPLQLGVIERALRLWSADGDLVFSPFAGIGSEGFVAIQMGRRFLGAELKESYWRQAALNLKDAKREQGDLFESLSS